MKLNIKERLLMSQLYPQQGNIAQQILVRDISKKVGITQDELKEYGIKSLENGGLTWEKDAEKEVALSGAELNLLKEQVAKLDKENRVTMELLDLFLKIKEVE
jgi:transposase-like protein